MADKTLFPDSVIKAAQNAQRKWGPPACVPLAQYYIESSCGRFEPAGSHNGLGIQEIEGVPFVTSMSHEWREGKLVPVEEHFAKFESDEEEFDRWGWLIATRNISAYRLAMAHIDNWQDFARFMSKAYSTTTMANGASSDYYDTLVKVVQQFDLTTFNLKRDAPMYTGDAEAFKVGGSWWVQNELVKAGFNIGEHGVDGFIGPDTMKAIGEYQASRGLTETATIDAQTVTALANGMPPEDKSNAPAE
jgi:hypothetical protein